MMIFDTASFERCRMVLSERRAKAEKEAAERREELFARCPRLKEIEDRLSTLGIQAVNSALERKKEIGRLIAEMEAESLTLQKEEAALLKAMGFSSEILLPTYVCKTCHDTGVDANGKRCRCMDALLKQDAYAELAKSCPLKTSDFESFRLDYYPEEPDETGVSPRKRIEKIFAYCREYARDFSVNSPSLLFLGNTGLGKTHLALAIAEIAIEKQFGVLYNSCQALISRLEDEHFGRVKATGMEETVCSCDLLILDDLGTEFASNFSSSMIYSILNTRLCAGLPTIISTNLTPEEMEARYTDRLVSRLFSAYKTFRFTGKDIRLIRAWNEK